MLTETGVSNQRIDELQRVYQEVQDTLSPDVPYYTDPIAIAADQDAAVKVARNICRAWYGDISDARYKRNLEERFNISKITFGNGQRSPSEVRRVDLKPQSFPGVAHDTKYHSYSGYIDVVESAVMGREDMTMQLKHYLVCILKYFDGECTGTELARVYREAAPYIPNMKDVINDFGEIIAPICFLHDRESSKEPYKFDKNRARINLPVRGNEPLVDFYMKKGPRGNKYGFSVKALDSAATNTVKPSTFFEVYEDGPFEGSTRKQVQEALNVFKDIDDTKPAYAGHVVAVLNLAQKYPQFKSAYASMFTQPNEIVRKINAASFNKKDPIGKVLGRGTDEAQAREFIDQFAPRKSPNYSMQNFSWAAEKAIIAANDDGILDFLPLFKEFVLKKVVYTKMAIRSGVPLCEIMTYANIPAGKKAKLRQKNSFNDYQDVIGIQI